MSPARSKRRRSSRARTAGRPRKTPPRNLQAEALIRDGNRRRSRNVTLGAVGVILAGGLLTYAATEDRRCVDGSNQVVSDSHCKGGTGGSGGTGVYRWYYGGGSSGGRATGGSFERGGFGRAFSGFHGG